MNVVRSWVVINHIQGLVCTNYQNMGAILTALLFNDNGLLGRVEGSITQPICDKDNHIL